MKLLVIWMGWLLIWSTTIKDPTQPRSETATLYIYRGREFSALNYGIMVNGKRVSTLTSNRYLRVEIPAGKTVLETEKNYFSKEKAAFFMAESGKTYYVKAVDDADFMTRTLIFGFVSEDQAKRELARIKPMEPETPDNP